MDTSSVVILICGVVAVLVLVVLILFLGSRRKARRAGTSHTTAAPAPTRGRPSHAREDTP